MMFLVTTSSGENVKNKKRWKFYGGFVWHTVLFTIFSIKIYKNIFMLTSLVIFIIYGNYL